MPPKLIPYGLTADQFATRFRGLLEKHSFALLTELREVLALPIGPAVTAVSVKIFLDDVGEFGPSIAMYFDGKDKKLDHSDPSIFPGRHLPLAKFLKDIQLFDERYFSDDDFSALYIQANVSKTWFAEWWWKAGGWAYPLPAEVEVHDDHGDGNRIQLAPGC